MLRPELRRGMLDPRVEEGVVVDGKGWYASFSFIVASSFSQLAECTYCRMRVSVVCLFLAATISVALEPQRRDASTTAPDSVSTSASESGFDIAQISTAM